MSEAWRVVRNGSNHWGMIEVEGPAISVRGFTIANDVSHERAMLIEQHAALIAGAPELISEMRRLLDHFETWARDNSTDATAETWAIIHCSHAILDKFGF